MGDIWTNRAAAEYFGVRVYRNAAHSLSNTLAQLPFDSTSTLLAPEGLSLSGGDIVCAVDGEVSMGTFITSGMDIATGHEIEIRLNPAGANTLVAYAIRPGVTGSQQTDHCDAVCDVVAGDVLRVNVAVSGTSADITIGDGITWAYATITPR